MIQKIKQKTVKDFMFNEKHRVNVVSISEDGRNNKFYNIDIPFSVILNSKDRSRNIQIRDINLRSNDEAKEQLKKLNELINELTELKDVYEFIVNQSDINFEREEKIKRII